MTVARILIVGEEPRTALELQDNLVRTEYEVIAFASDIEEAVEKAHALNPDIILMDFNLVDDVKRLDAAHEVKLQFNMPVVFVTTNLNAEGNAKDGVSFCKARLRSMN